MSCDMSNWLLQGLKYYLEKIFAIPIHMQKEASEPMQSSILCKWYAHIGCNKLSLSRHHLLHHHSKLPNSSLHMRKKRFQNYLSSLRRSLTVEKSLISAHSALKGASSFHCYTVVFWQTRGLVTRIRWWDPSHLLDYSSRMNLWAKRRHVCEFLIP